MEKTIFISHRSTDKMVAELFLDFICALGIPREVIFCSSLPGNDVKEKISDEVKLALYESKVNIVILSNEYYQSAYCLNEAGIFWYKSDLVIPIALPEIQSEDMIGFLNNDYKLRVLESEDDLAYIYDAICKTLSLPLVDSSIFISEMKKLKSRYKSLLDHRVISDTDVDRSKIKNRIDVNCSTDDELIVIYYIIKQKIRKVTKADVLQWMVDEEIENVNVDNAFDLLSTVGDGKLRDNALELDIDVFRSYLAIEKEEYETIEHCYEKHKVLRANIFCNMWLNGRIDELCKLFFCYIVDEKEFVFCDRWMIDFQVESIKQWEKKNNLDAIISANYQSFLNFLITCKFVYESDWTEYGNPRQHSMYRSLKDLLSDCPTEYREELDRIKKEHLIDLPF